MNKVKWLRISYRLGAAVDFLIAGLVLVPDLAGTPDYIYSSGLFSAAAFSWGIMLLIADRKPLERRWVLVPTLVVVALLGFATVHALAVGLQSWFLAVPSLVSSISVFTIMAYGYTAARQ